LGQPLPIKSHSDGSRDAVRRAGGSQTGTEHLAPTRVAVLPGILFARTCLGFAVRVRVFRVSVGHF